MAVRQGSSFRVQLLVWRRRKGLFCAMLVLFGVYPVPRLLLTWRAEEADGLGTTPNLFVLLYHAQGEEAKKRMAGGLFIRLL